MTDSLLFIIGMFLGVLGLTGMAISEATSDKESLMTSVRITVFSAACLGLCFYTSYQLQNQPWIREDPYVTHQIMALQDGNEINGRFNGRKYGMSGYINEEFMYVYGYKTYTGGMKIQKVSEKQTTVYFSDNVSPNAKWYKETRKFWWSKDERYTCDIFIPTGSLQANITIDLQ